MGKNKGNLTIEEEEYFLIEKMIKESNNTATSFFWKKLGNEKYFNYFFKEIGCNQTKVGKNGFWGLSTINIIDGLTILKLLVLKNNFINEEQQKYIQSLLKCVKEEQAFGYKHTKEMGYNVYQKNGWSPKEDNNWRINTLSILKKGHKTYGLIVLSEKNPSLEIGENNLNEIVKKAMLKLK